MPGIFTRARRGSISPGGFRLARDFRDNNGTVAIEFALVLVVFLAILFGIVMFGFQFAARIGLSYAVAEGGRSAVAGLTTAERRQRAIDGVNRVLTSLSPLIDPNRAVVSVTPLGETTDGEAFQIAVIYDDDRFNVFPFMPDLASTRAVETTFLVADPSG
jgi:Flp pilus assembly protein TadG